MYGSRFIPDAPVIDSSISDPVTPSPVTPPVSPDENESVTDTWPAKLELPAILPDWTEVDPANRDCQYTTKLQEKLSLLWSSVKENAGYNKKVLFNIGWMLEQIRICLQEIKLANAPGTQTATFKSNLEGLEEGTSELETAAVFSD